MSEVRANWIIEAETWHKRIEEELVTEIERQGRHVKMITYRPFDDDATQLLNMFDEKKCVISYCSLNLARKIDKHAPWTPSIYCTLKNYECYNYYPYVGALILNSDYFMIPYGELMRMKDRLFKIFGQDNSIFIRPSSGFKLFTGTLLYNKDIRKQLDQIELYGIEPHNIIVVSSPKTIIRE